MSRRPTVRLLPNSAIYQRFVRRPVRLVMPCDALYRRISWMKSWILGPQAVSDRTSTDSSSEQSVPTVVAMVETLVGHHEIDGLAGCITIVQRNVQRVRRPDPR